MTAADLARFHARAMEFPAPWSAKDFSELLTSPGVFLSLPASSVQKYPGGSARGAAPLSSGATTKSAQDLTGFALGRVVLDEAELLTLVVDPDLWRQGIGGACLAAFEAEAQRLGANRAFLEVAATNDPARNLYIRHGWAETGIRRGYYRHKPGPVDAILMTKTPI